MTTAEDGEVRVTRARIEEIRELAAEYAREQQTSRGATSDAPLPEGGIFWLARDGAGRALGYAAGTMRPIGCHVGPVFTRPEARRRGVGEALVSAIQVWAADTRVPVVEISVAADDPAGQAFLESLGYVPRRVLMSLTPERPRSGASGA